MITSSLHTAFLELVNVVARLRAPDGCPWDREQTPKSATAYLIEESHEAAEAIDHGTPADVCEELGDVLLQVIFQSQMVADTTAAFSLEQVIAGVTEKLVRRHPHVFGEVAVKDSAEVLANWEVIKRSEKPKRESMLDGLPKGLPALLHAFRLGQKAARVGFDWPDANGVVEKIAEEAREIVEARAATTTAATENVAAEIGDLLFAAAQLARTFDVDPESALRGANARFTQRFQHMERSLAATARDARAMSAAEWDALWNRAKQECAS